MIGTAVLLVFAATPNHTAASSTLAPAESGFVQCYEPNEISKTCASLASYTRNDDGTWNNTAVVLLSPNETVTLETTTPVQIKEGAVCGFIRRADIMQGELRVSGRAVPAEQATSALAKIADGMAPLVDREICTEYLDAGESLVAKARISDGTIVVPNQRVKWVLPSQGYSVTPAAAANPK